MPWEVRFSNSRQIPYFYDNATNTSRWEAPAGMSEDEVRALPGAAKYLTSGGGGQQAPPGQVRASHILAKHAGSRRPSSWRQATITRPISEARTIIQAHIDNLKQLPPSAQAEKFAEIASRESDCSSAKKGGDLGLFGKGQMQAAFEEATFALQPGQMSGLVETDSGVHVILRTA